MIFSTNPAWLSVLQSIEQQLVDQSIRQLQHRTNLNIGRLPDRAEYDGDASEVYSKTCRAGLMHEIWVCP